MLDREVSEGTAQELSAVEVTKRVDTLGALGSNVVQAFIVVIALLMILGELGIDIGPAIAGLGVVGIAVGFGSQSLVRDYFNGSLIMLENQFSRGDVVSVAGVTGTVEDFSLRTTTIRDLDGVVHTVPNGEIKVASNRTRVWARINQDVTVAYGTDIEKATTRRQRGRRGDGRRSGLATPGRSRRRGSSGSRRWASTASRSRCWAWSGRPSSPPPAASSVGGCSSPSRRNGIEIPRPQRVVLAPSTDLDPFQAGGTTLPGPDPGRAVGRRGLSRASRVAPRPTPGAGRPVGQAAARRMARPTR